MGSSEPRSCRESGGGTVQFDKDSKAQTSRMVHKYANMKYVPLMVFQLIVMALYFVFVQYGGETDFDIRVRRADVKADEPPDGKWSSSSMDTSNTRGVTSATPALKENSFYTFFEEPHDIALRENLRRKFIPQFAGFEDSHVMIFVGFGFLMTFLKKYCYSALGFNWFLAALVVQWALLCQSFYHMKDNTIFITKKSILEADIMSATVLITFGAVLGAASGLQLLFIGIVETVIACFNFWIVEHIFKAADVGGSIAIHAFGAYFGLGLSWALTPKKQAETTPAVNLNGPSYTSDVTAMIGSLFLWIYWPSFNSALTTTNAEYQRAVINTYLALASATVTTFIMSSLVSHHGGKFDMVHVQNSTLAGGVAVGSVSNMFITAGGAVAIGIGAGILSVLGYRFLTPKLEKLGVGDTCGVNNLHGMPGIYSGLLTVLFAALATPKQYGPELSNIFEAMKEDNTGITAGKQALNQFLALIVTLVVSTIGGVITGFLARVPVFDALKESDKYDDEVNWELP